MFRGASSFNQPLGKWRVDKVVNMSFMFHEASSFNQPLSDWRVDNVTEMIGMFKNASSFDQPLGDWQLWRACSTHEMFMGTNFQNSRPVGGCGCPVVLRDCIVS